MYRVCTVFIKLLCTLNVFIAMTCDMESYIIFISINFILYEKCSARILSWSNRMIYL